MINPHDLSKKNLGVCLYDNTPLDYHDDVSILKLVHFKAV